MHALRTPRRAPLSFTLLALLAGLVVAPRAASAPGTSERPTPSKVEEELPGLHRVERGEGEQPLLLPVGEQLEYVATLRTALADIEVGRVELAAGVDAFRRSLLASASNRKGGDTGWVKARAYGDYTLYVMDARLETRFQPQAWPFSVHSYRHEGTEKRRRELLTGEKGGEWVASYRGDTSQGAPEGLRIWGEARERAVPRGALDSLSAVYLVRSAMLQGLSETHFAMLDKDRLWDVSVSLGDPQPVETPAGRFLGRLVGLSTRRLDGGAPAAGEGDDGGQGEFAGPFGIKGNLELWLEANTGIPLVIKGELPVVLGDLRVDLKLRTFSGTPEGFEPVE